MLDQTHTFAPGLTTDIALPVILDPAIETRRVLHIINGEHYAGAERVQDLLAQRLPEFGFEVTFACLKPDRFPALRQARRNPLFAVSMRSKLDLWPARELARLVRDQEIEVIHTHTARSALVGSMVASLAKVPMVHHLHSPAAADSTHRIRNRINAATERFTVGRARAVIAVSSSLADYAVCSGLTKVRPVVVTNGVPVVEPMIDRPAPQGRWTLGVVALFRPRKGLEVLLEAMAAIVARGSDVRLRAVGRFETPDYEREIHALAERLELSKRIDWRGFQTDVNSELAAIDVLVLPSLFGEGMPMVVLEAMAAGAPVVATRVEGVGEAVRHEHDGLIVEPGDAESLAAALRRFIERDVDWRAMSAAARNRQV
ncbi:MAG TPA: glycosyltransferase, partial [Pirellulales bacterium]|nr:glycosyltransferase [Pirellulales bacterium]